jgi:hypothetical protein
VNVSVNQIPHKHRMTLAQIAFVVLVILIPVAFGIGFAEHQRTTDIAKIVSERRQMLLDSCARANFVRRDHNALVSRVTNISEVMADYLTLDASTKRPPLNVPELATVTRLRNEIIANGKAAVLPIVDCTKTIR